ncbi:MAG: ABC transporter permease subunit [Planctomycetota bacterium]
MSRKPSQSLFARRWRKFKSLKRGYICFHLLVWSYLASWLLPFLVNSEALWVSYKGQSFFPAFTLREERASEFGLSHDGAPNYRALKGLLEKSGEGRVLLPPYPFSPRELLVDLSEEIKADATSGHLKALEGSPPHAPSRHHWCGTDLAGRDVFARLTWGYRISLSFALLCVLVEYIIGVAVGAVLGYFGGKVDILGQRLLEILSGVPFLYLIMIISRVWVPREEVTAFFILVGIMCLLGWIGTTYYVRGEYYREKAKDYVAAGVAQGEGHLSLMFRHILPNTLTPIITFAPFAVVGAIGALVSLDFLGFGLPVGTPSWGELLNQGKEQMTSGKWWLSVFPLGAMFSTLMIVVFIGEAVREAFDPKVFSRLR